jgi:hypothetical protein
MTLQSSIMQRAIKKGMDFKQWLAIYAPQFPQIREVL